MTLKRLSFLLFGFLILLEMSVYNLAVADSNNNHLHNNTNQNQSSNNHLHNNTTVNPVIIDADRTTLKSKNKAESNSNSSAGAFNATKVKNSNGGNSFSTTNKSKGYVDSSMVSYGATHGAKLGPVGIQWKSKKWIPYKHDFLTAAEKKTNYCIHTLGINKARVTSFCQDAVKEHDRLRTAVYDRNTPDNMGGD